jgi:septum formation protein
LVIVQPLLLASASPRRAELLRAAGFEFDIRPATVDESPLAGEHPERYVHRLAEAKARAILPFAGNRVVLAADTTVVVDGRILGKPVDADDAGGMLRALAGRRHEVLTGVTLARGPHVLTRVETTGVHIAPMTDEEITWYVTSGEPADKAGAYAVQGLAARFVTRIEGSYSNVVGLPIALVYSMLRDMG